MNAVSEHIEARAAPLQVRSELLQLISYLENLGNELEGTLEQFAPGPVLRMALHLMRAHLEARIVTPTALIAASRVPYATANRRMREMIAADLIEQRPRTKTGKSVSLHPSAALIEEWTRMSGRIARLTEAQFGGTRRAEAQDYYFGGSYLGSHSIPPLQALPEPLKLPDGIRVLVHGDPTFMVMDGLKRQFEQVVGTRIHQRAFSIDRLRDEALKNAERDASRYDIIALDLPWIGEFAEKGLLLPLEEVLDVDRLDPTDFHTAGWSAAHWAGKPYAVPAQTTPELLFYRRDLFAEAGLEPPADTEALLEAAEALHAPHHRRYGIAWNAARGTALGHTVLMTLADFGQPVLDPPDIVGDFGTSRLSEGGYRVTLDTERGLAAAEFLMQLLRFSPLDILSMSWYERVRPFASGSVAMAYGYTLLAPYFELDSDSPAAGQTGYLPHPPAPGVAAVAPVGGYVLGIPANLPAERRAAAAEALVVFTSPAAQKTFVQNGSRTNPRFSVGADLEVRRASPIFEAVDGMLRREELQFWPRPPIPEICGLIQVCGEEFHDMLRGIVSPREALARAQARADALIPPPKR